MLFCQELFTFLLIWAKESQAKCQLIVCSTKILKKPQVQWMPKRCFSEDLKAGQTIEFSVRNNRRSQLKSMSTLRTSLNLEISLVIVTQV